MTTVLFVSHNAELRAVASRVLMNAGCRVTAAAHAGHASLACMEGNAFDVLIVEDQMPDGSGAALVERVRRSCPDVEVVRMCNGPVASADGIAVVRPFTAYDLIGAVSDATVYARRGAMTR